MNVNTRKLGYTTSEAARRLGVSLSTIRRWSDMGHLRGYRTPGGQRRFSAQQLDEFLASLEDGTPLRQARADDVADDEPGVHRHHDDPHGPVAGEPGAVTERSSSPRFWPPASAA